LTRCGSHWSPQQKRWACPAHYDRAYSLSVSTEFDLSVRLHCSGGCSVGRILGAIGMTFFDIASPAFDQEKDVA
jgi:hypothetical protein